MRAISCPLCGAEGPVVFLERRPTPLHQNLLCQTSAEAKALNCGELAISHCRRCDFVFNAVFHPELMLYSPAYDNTQFYSPFFSRCMTEVADSLVERLHLVGKFILEVGCGKGEFLQLLCRGGRNRGLGFDPSYIGPQTAEQGAVRFVPEFYTGQRGDRPPDLVCCRHVMAHVPAPLEFLRGIRTALGEHSDVVLYLETPDVEWAFEHTAFEDFFYEYCSYFSPDTLAWAVEMSGFSVGNVKKMFGGQYFALEAKPKIAWPPVEVPPPQKSGRIEKEVRTFSDNMARKINDCLEQVQRLRRQGGCALWGAGARGVTFANILDPGGTDIQCIVDISPAKAGKHVPGTGHPIVSPEALRHDYSVAGILSMNPHYLEEQRAMLSQLSLAIPVEALTETPA